MSDNQDHQDNPPVSPLQQALEDAILNDWEDVASHSAYADYLHDQGDPRGELIQIQLSLEQDDHSPADRKKLEKREAKLMKKHRKEWLGELAESFMKEPSEPPPVWARHRVRNAVISRGWITQLAVDELTVDLARLLARSPHLDHLHELVIHSTGYYGYAGMEGEPTYEPDDLVPEGEEHPALLPLADCEWLRNLRSFTLGDQVFLHSSQANATGLIDMVARMHQLTELRLLAHDIEVDDLFSMKMPNLRLLQVYHSHDYPMDILAKNRSLKKLTHLLCQAHALEYGDEPYIDFEELRSITRSKQLKSLTHLELRVTNFGDPGCEEIVRSGILKRLKHLDLRAGCITDKGALTLAGCNDLDNLEYLELNRNWLTIEGIREIQSVLPHAQVEDQINPEQDPWLHMYEGDME